jgi:hypothetical protein
MRSGGGVSGNDVDQALDVTISAVFTTALLVSMNSFDDSDDDDRNL